MPDAARISDLHVCPKVEPGPVPHVGGPVFAGSANVIVGYMPAARVGDAVICIPIGPTDKISEGSSTVVINHRAAARRTDPCTHIAGSRIVSGCPTVIIGDSPQSFTFRAAAKRGTPFCEECERRKREREAQEREGEDNTDERPSDTATLDDEHAKDPAHSHVSLGFQSVDMIAAAGAATDAGGDGLSQRSARIAVAYKFLASKSGARVKPSEIHSHIAGIDLSKPVEVVPVAGKTLYQHGFPGGKNGSYFATDGDAAADELGISPTVYATKDGATVLPELPRERREIQFGDTPAYGLKSTAGPITDTWSLRGSATAPAKAVDCAGGAEQIVIPPSFQTATTTTVRL